jgi:hypothetical protein
MPSLPQREAEGVKALRPLRGDRANPVGLDALGLLRQWAGKVKGVVWVCAVRSITLFRHPELDSGPSFTVRAAGS